MSFNPAMLTLAREAVGITQEGMAHQLGVSQPTVHKVEAGLNEPAEPMMRSMADICSVPVAFFVQTDPILGEGIVDFFHRRRRTLPAKPLRKAHAQANILRLELMRLLRHIELDDVAPFPAVTGDDMPPEDAAELTRALWRLPPGPLPDLIGLVESAGIPVIQMSLGHEKLRAISLPSHDGRHLVILNNDLPASNQRFSLAHELGHLVMHYRAVTEDIEEQADAFASALLTPKRDIERELRGLRFADLGVLKQRWRVSMQTLVRTARDVGGISDRQYRTFHIEMNRLPGGRKREPGEFPAETPRLVDQILKHYTGTIGYSVSDLATLMVATEERVRTFYLRETARVLRPLGRPLGVIHLS